MIFNVFSSFLVQKRLESHRFQPRWSVPEVRLDAHARLQARKGGAHVPFSK